MPYEAEIADYQRRCDQAGLPGRVVYRRDRRTVPSDLCLRLDATTETAEGFLLVPGSRVAVPGILEYPRDDGSIQRELVLYEDLHEPESLASLERKPLTLLHPDVDVGPHNIQEFGVGDLVNVRSEPEDEGGHVLADVAIRRADAIEAARSREAAELSLGYLTRLIETPGDHPVYGEYHAKQVGRRYNHGAQVPEGRAGPTVALNLDAAGTGVTTDTNPGEASHMDETKLTAGLDAVKLLLRADAADPAKVTAALVGAGISEEMAGKIAAIIAGGASAEEPAAPPAAAEGADADDPGKVEELEAALATMTEERDALAGQLDAHQAAGADGGASKTEHDGDPPAMSAEEKDDASKFGDNLKRLAEEKEVSTEELGKAAGIEAGTVNQIMSGEIAVPPEERIKAFAKVLGVSASSLHEKLPAEAKEETEDRSDSAADRLAWFDQRNKLLQLASRYDGVTDEQKRLDNAGLARVVATASGATVEGRSDVYVAAYLDAKASMRVDSTDAVHSGLDLGGGSRGDGAPPAPRRELGGDVQAQTLNERFEARRNKGKA